MSIVLGWHGGVSPRVSPYYQFHDGAAAILKDGRVIAAIEEERLNRIKHSNFFPTSAIKFCCNQARINLAEVDHVTLDVLETTLDDFAVSEALKHPDLAVRTGRELLVSTFQQEFDVDIADKLRFCHHHMAHLYGSVYTSGFETCLVVSLDGSGDKLSGMVAIFDGERIIPIKSYSRNQSLGNFYSWFLSFLGYGRFDEYKVMGLAPYGDPVTFERMFQACYSLLPGGEVEFASDDEKLQLAKRNGLLDHIRRKGQPFSSFHKDLAAALQVALERLSFHILLHFASVTNERKLCLSGGVVHNCSMNGKILYSGAFEDIFVPPAAHDGGNALGAAIATAVESGQRLSKNKLVHVFLGSNICTGSDIVKQLRPWADFLEWRREDSIAEKTAALLADGLIVAWVQGRSEFGPRALGNRSIIADPRPVDNKARINDMVKKRESYRPFAPSVLEERLHDYFEIPNGRADLSFMTFVLKVRQEMRGILGAITHVDGTARVQTVTKEANPLYYNLISSFGEITGIYVILNTSFNNYAEPIVDSVNDAIVCYLTTRIDCLVVGDYLVKRKWDRPEDMPIGTLVPAIASKHRLVQCLGSPDGIEYGIECLAPTYRSCPIVHISKEVFQLLLVQDTTKSLNESCLDLNTTGNDQMESIERELLELWQRRVVVLTPGGIP